MLSKLREPVNGLTHFFAGLAAIAGLIILLVIGRGDLQKQASLAVYGASLVLLLFASATYHLTVASPERIQFLRKLDHTAIYFLIAGTYTPLCIIVFTGFWKWGLLAIIWAIAVAGTGFKIAFIKAPRWLTAGIYVAMGWLGVIGIGEFLRLLPVGAIIWLAAGGLFFTVGAVVYVTQTMNFVPGVFGFHEVWHLFVIGGCFCHYMLILLYVAPYIRIG